MTSKWGVKSSEGSPLDMKGTFGNDNMFIKPELVDRAVSAKTKPPTPPPKEIISPDDIKQLLEYIRLMEQSSVQLQVQMKTMLE